MHRRRLGRTGFEVSEVGFGAWGIGGTTWLGADDDESLRALHRAVDLGLDFVDTALAYGDGHSERLVGRVVRERRAAVRIATKVPPANGHWPARAEDDPDEAFPAAHVRACTERSLHNLGVEAIDLQQLHVWTDAWVGRGEWLAELQRLKRAGMIRAIGVSVGDHAPETALRVVESGAVDTIQVVYNVFDQAPADALLDLCRRHDVGVIARVPLDEGALTGNVTRHTRFPAGDFRNRYFRWPRKRLVERRVNALLHDVGIERGQLAEVALRFVLSHPAVSTVIPGMRTVANVERNCAVADGRGLPADVLAKVERHAWPRNFYKLI